MEPSSTLYAGLLEDDQLLAAAASSKRRWKVTAVVGGIAALAMSAAALSLANERVALQTQLAEQQKRVSPTPAAAARTARMHTSALAFGNVLAKDTCTVAGKDIYGQSCMPCRARACHTDHGAESTRAAPLPNPPRAPPHTF